MQKLALVIIWRLALEYFTRKEDFQQNKIVLTSGGKQQRPVG